MHQDIQNYIEQLYGTEKAGEVAAEMQALIDKWRPVLCQEFSADYTASEDPDEGLPLDQRHVVMITYGDSIRRPQPLADGSIAFCGHTQEAPLQTLKEFADEYLQDIVSTIHLLPCFPYTSDDGFSVVDYRAIDPELGSWQDIGHLRENFQLMYDLVLNHCSQASQWFRGFLAGEPQYADFFCTAEPDDVRLKQVFRPRALPLLHEFDCTDADGKQTGQSKWVWTTFSRDQVDANFANPRVLLEYCDIFLHYLSSGAQIVRLDAIGFLWKELGSSCMHHPKTHTVVKLLRSLLCELAPSSVLLTETNVPQPENISYFGDGDNEAQMVYQFSLPPLVLDCFVRGDASHLAAWAKELPPPNEQHTFFNFLASHDGIGLLPARGYLSQQEQEQLVQLVLARGGQIGYKATAEGKIPYELNINYLDAIAEPESPPAQRAAKFLAAQSILLAMAGVPGIYVHSILGSVGWRDGVKESGIPRRINRQKLDVDALRGELQQKGSLRQLVYRGLQKMLRLRRIFGAFHPSAPQCILDLPPQLFGLVRGQDPQGIQSTEVIYCLVNCTAEQVACPPSAIGWDLIGRKFYTGHQHLEPYQVLWLVNL